jgi:PPM family protein phosphatase
MTLQVWAAHHSDRGDRADNEDCAIVSDDGHLLAVADGMGGQRGGQVASRLSTEAAQSGLAQLLQCENDQRIFEQQQQIFQDANSRLLDAAQRDLELLGMGTTLTLAFIRVQKLYLAHVGDSRLYLWRDHQCQQLSRDHTRARDLIESGALSEQQAARSLQRNVLTRYIGTVQRIEPEFGLHVIAPNDRLLLCSDGLYNCLSLEAITDALGTGTQPSAIAENLVRQARAEGGQNLDNITALVALLGA